MNDEVLKARFRPLVWGLLFNRGAGRGGASLSGVGVFVPWSGDFFLIVSLPAMLEHEEEKMFSSPGLGTSF